MVSVRQCVGATLYNTSEGATLYNTSEGATLDRPTHHHHTISLASLVIFTTLATLAHIQSPNIQTSSPIDMDPPSNINDGPIQSR